MKIITEVLKYIGLGILNVLIVLGVILLFALVVGVTLFLGAILVDAGHPYLGFGWYIVELIGMGTAIAYTERNPVDF